MCMFFIGIGILLFSGILANIFPERFKTAVLTVLCGIGAALCVLPAVNVFFLGDMYVTFNFNSLFGDVTFAIDRLSAFFVLVISLMSFLSLVYSNGYLKPCINSGKNISSHLIFLPLLIASMLLVVTCRNAFMFLICWEIMSLSSFFLVIFENEKKEVRRAGIKYLIFMHVSVIFIILAFVFASINAGSYDFDAFKNILSNNSKYADIVFLLGFIGFGTKAGFVPFHNWLPSAHPEAPSHVSAMMSGVMIKTGIYGILRLIELVSIPSKFMAYTVLIVSVITALYGVLYAVTGKNIKKLLAYSSIENIGIIGLGIGVGMLGLAWGNNLMAILGFAGGILHILNHSIFKELLFLSAGSVYLKTHTKNIETLGGLIKSMPYTAILFLVGAVAICGLPPLNGFISEILIYFGMFSGFAVKNFFTVILMILSIGGLALVGTMALLCFSKAFSVIFLGLPRSEVAQKVENDVPLSMIAPLVLLGIFALLIGIFPVQVFGFIENVVLSFVPLNSKVLPTQPLELLQTIAFYTLTFVLFLGCLVAVKFMLTKKPRSGVQTWGCGYNKPNNKMQYTASSYASPFLAMLKPLFKKVFDVEKPRKLFPKSAHFSLQIEDIEEAYVINPLIKFDEKFLSKFETLQSGNIQSYIKFGLIFLVVILIISVFIR